MRTAASKIGTLAEVAPRVREARAAGKRVALASGAFELLHPALVRGLADARAGVDVLVVAVRSAPQPLVADAERALLVAALRAVDHVVVIPADEMAAAVLALSPDVRLPEDDGAATRALLERLRQ